MLLCPSSPEPQAPQAGFFQQKLQIPGERAAKCPHCPWRTGVQTPPTSAASPPELVISAPTQGPLECLSHFPLDFNTQQVWERDSAASQCFWTAQTHPSCKIQPGSSLVLGWGVLGDTAALAPGGGCSQHLSLLPTSQTTGNDRNCWHSSAATGFLSLSPVLKGNSEVFPLPREYGWILDFSTSPVWGSMETPGPQGHTRVSNPCPTCSCPPTGGSFALDTLTWMLTLRPAINHLIHLFDNLPFGGLHKK